jgi:hypothetical protein
MSGLGWELVRENCGVTRFHLLVSVLPLAGVMIAGVRHPAVEVVTILLTDAWLRENE